MFLSYKLLEDIKATKSNPVSWRYGIIDSEFEETGIMVGYIGSMAAELGIAVIETYEKRNLNVAANLVRAFIWARKKYGYYSINYIVALNETYNPKFTKYEDQINKYLTLV